ncbi:MAG: SLOG family protein [Blautia sp.]
MTWMIIKRSWLIYLVHGKYNMQRSTPGKENYMNSFSCVITGHRPTRFKFKYNEKDKRCQRIKKCLQEQLIRLYHQGSNDGTWVGGAMGSRYVGSGAPATYERAASVSRCGIVSGSPF